jgi:hypothetical protein
MLPQRGSDTLMANDERAAKRPRTQPLQRQLPSDRLGRTAVIANASRPERQGRAPC